MDDAVQAPSGAEHSPVIDAAQMGVLDGIVRTARPRQWAKNVLVAAAPLAAGVLFHADVWWRVILVFVAFCALSSGGYFVNDALDMARDQLHPTKRLRPIARGVVSRQTAFVTSGALFLLGFGICLGLGWKTLAVAAAYVALTVTYSFVFKHQPVVEMVLVAGAFVLRAAAGGEAARVTLSPWFTVVVSFGALLVVAGKRYAEQRALGVGSVETRKVLAEYPEGFLRFVWALAATITVAGYCLWALLPTHSPVIAAPWPEISIAPFLVAILRYAMLLETGSGEAPEDVFLGDRILQVTGLVWVVVCVTGMYA
jgi:decaprenyl-phosphate phosphoribosyltransferase